MSFLFTSFSVVKIMIDCLLAYQTCHELFVNFNFLVLLCVWLHAWLSFDPLFDLVKLFLYHVNFVAQAAEKVSFPSPNGSDFCYLLATKIIKTIARNEPLKQSMKPWKGPLPK
jgi:hypothetical protein